MIILMVSRVDNKFRSSGYCYIKEKGDFFYLHIATDDASLNGHTFLLNTSLYGQVFDNQSSSYCKKICVSKMCLY